MCAGAYLLWVDRLRCAAFVLGGLPFLLFLTAYNHHYFGHPLAFGQSVVASGITPPRTWTRVLRPASRWSRRTACGASAGLIENEWRLSRFTLNSMLPVWSLPGRKSPLAT